jgi:hypothetical protein
MKQLLPFILLIVVTVSVQAQKLVHDAPELIEWNEFYNLTWADFQGEPTEGSMGDAGTAVLIKAKPYYVKDQILYDVEAYFNRNKSWKRAKSDVLLKHEQLHFDIAELYARKIRKKIADLKRRGTTDLQVYNAAIKALLQESNEVDQRYDLETLHGALQGKQALWEQQVSEQLQGLKYYKKRKRVITAEEGLKKQGLIFGR